MRDSPGLRSFPERADCMLVQHSPAAAPIWTTAMGIPRIFTCAIALAALSACAQMNSRARPDPSAIARLQADPVIAAETQTLNRLTRIAIDANRLYDQAAENADDADLQAALRTMSIQRKTFAQSLQKRVADMGGRPAETGQATGAVHRSFLALRGLVEDDSAAATAEVYRGESYIIDELEKALETKLTGASRQIVQAELGRVMAGRDQVEQMQAQLAARHADEPAQEGQESPG
jgi:uncharacterized protein (TIGR02284 family)